MRKYLLLLSVAVCAVKAASEPGYDEQTIEGWQVRVEKSLAAQSPDVLTATLGVLRAQLYGIARVVPPTALEKIQAVPIWVHRRSGTKCMAFHPSAKWLGEHGFNPRMASAIEIGDVANFRNWTKEQPWIS